MLTLDEIKELMPEAYQVTIQRYGWTGDVEGALIFFCAAIGLLCREPTDDDLEWAKRFVFKLSPSKD